MAVDIPGLAAVSSSPTIPEAHPTPEGVAIASLKTFCDPPGAVLADLSK